VVAENLLQELRIGSLLADGTNTLRVLPVWHGVCLGTMAY
jgi:hypothetical protein